MTRPGDVRPPMLERPPGERYATSEPMSVMERPRMLRAIGLGAVAVLVVTLVYALLRGVLDLTTGTLAIAAAGGWVIGAAVRAGAWGGRAHRASSQPSVAAMSLGVICWVACLVGAWLVAMAILPGSSRTFLERLAGTQFLDWLTPQLGLADVLDLVLLVTLAWIGSRSGTTPGEVDAPGESPGVRPFR